MRLNTYIDANSVPKRRRAGSLPVTINCAISGGETHYLYASPLRHFYNLGAEMLRPGDNVTPSTNSKRSLHPVESNSRPCALHMYSHPGTRVTAGRWKSLPRVVARKKHKLTFMKRFPNFCATLLVNGMELGYMKLAPFGILYLLLATPLSLSAQPIRFVRESLVFALAADSFAFSGIYYFDNPGPAPVEQSIYYPFVISGSVPDSTNVIEVHSARKIPVATGQSGVSFVASMQPFSTQAYRISFVQRAPKRSFEYILKTTAAWGQPLDRMTITIQVPVDIVVKRVSLKSDSRLSTRGVMSYIIERDHFLPAENLIVRWERKIP